MRSMLVSLTLCIATSAWGVEHDCTEALHPPVVLRDRNGDPVISSGLPVSTMRSCAACHDTDYIAAHSYHVSAGHDERFATGTRAGRRAWDYSPGSFGRWSPLQYRYLTLPGDATLDLGTAEWIQKFGYRHVGGGPAIVGHGDQPLDSPEERTAPPSGKVDPDRQVLDATTREVRDWDWESSGTVEMNCFLCHVKKPDNQARIHALSTGHFSWANTATLAGTGIVQPQEDGWQYVASAFNTDGAVATSQLGLGEPTSEHCGQCHGQTHFEETPLQLNLSLAAWSTVTKGQVFSPQRISDSGINLEDKQQLNRPWDVHAAAMLECHNCHYSLNDPKSYESSRRGRPSHLRYEPRRLSIAQYVHHPSHQFAQGHTEQGSVARRLNGTMRGCGDCHDAESTHDWLPYAAQHLSQLHCEACHIPQTRAPAIQMVDWTMLSPDGKPRVEWRGITDDPEDPASTVTGFRPVLLPKRGLDGKSKLAPFNLITACYWVEGEATPRPVRAADLQAALLQDGAYHPAVLTAFDEDQDGQLSLSERNVDSAAKRQVVQERLAAVGVRHARLVSDVEAVGLHHGVGPAQTAIRHCEECHTAKSRLNASFPLAARPPYEAVPEFVGDGLVSLTGPMMVDATGQMALEPDTRNANLYVLGHNRWPWVNLLGGLSVLGALAGAVIHTGLRIRARRRPPTASTESGASR